VSGLPEGVEKFVSAESCYLKATNLVAAKDFDGAIKQYQQAIELDPHYADAIADCGAVHCIKGDFAQAETLYRQAIAARPDDGLFHANLARVLEQLGKPAEAKDELELAYRYAPKDKVVLTVLATRELTANHPDRATKLLSEALALYPRSSQLHERLSFALAKAGDVDQALAEARQAVLLDPKSSSAKLNLGSAQILHGDSVAAVDTYTEAIKLAPENPDGHYLLSRALEGRGDSPGAKAELEKMISLSAKDDPRALAAKKHLAELETSVPGR
jgi:Flp pilus assembly protein TadD